MNCGIILLGDFNKLDFKFVAKCFQSKPIINFPTRGLNILDQIFTNLKEYYSSPVASPDVASLGRFLTNIPWESLLSLRQSSEDKLSSVTEVINYGLNTIMPERRIKVYANDCPWMTQGLKRLILQRQKAFTTGKTVLFRLLRNKVNRERKRCRKLYYNAKVRELSGSKPRDWWREVKQLCGLKNLTKKSPVDFKNTL
jgi:hypothetical protein